MKAEKHYGFVQGGRLRASSLAAVIRSYPDGTELELTERIAKPRRTHPQNRFYWGVVVRIALVALRDFGTQLSPQELHEYWRRLFAPIDLRISGDGEIAQFGKSTTEMDTLEFAAYVEQCIAWCAERGIRVPGPGEQLEIDA